MNAIVVTSIGIVIVLGIILAAVPLVLNRSNQARRTREENIDSGPRSLRISEYGADPEFVNSVSTNAANLKMERRSQALDDEIGNNGSAFLQLMRSIPMPLDETTQTVLIGNSTSSLLPLTYSRSGSIIGIIGGATDKYSSAPYFAGLCGLHLGMDVVHVFCASGAASVISSYSPEFVVHPVLDRATAVAEIEPWLAGLQALVIGPGLGRNAVILNRVAELIALCAHLQKPVILDSDALILIKRRPELIRRVRHRNGIILTASTTDMHKMLSGFDNKSLEHLQANDYETIGRQLTKTLGKNFTLLEEGRFQDRIWTRREGDKAVDVVLGLPGGSNRRCEGQGHVLSGATASFYAWALQKQQQDETSSSRRPAVLACQAASFLTRVCNERAFAKRGRGMLVSDINEQVSSVFRDYFEPSNVM